MRFEIFDGPISVGSVALEGGGRIHLRVRDPEHRSFLTEYFAGEALDAEREEFEIRRPDWSAIDFERAVLRLREVRSLEVVTRSVGPADEG